MELQIIGDGSFGSFLKELLSPYFKLMENDAPNVILAVPITAYEDVAKKYKGKHLINVCSVQTPSTEICLKYSDRVTSLHPLFGRRTPEDKRNTIVCRWLDTDNDTWINQNTESMEFVQTFSIVSRLIHDWNGKVFTPELHDRLMAKTHASALMGAQMLKVFTDRVKDVPDKLIPNSFRLMRDFVKTLEDMPQGTIDSILANPFI